LGCGLAWMEGLWLRMGCEGWSVRWCAPSGLVLAVDMAGDDNGLNGPCLVSDSVCGDPSSLLTATVIHVGYEI